MNNRMYIRQISRRIGYLTNRKRKLTIAEHFELIKISRKLDSLLVLFEGAK